jgi:hypothetical protein
MAAPRRSPFHALALTIGALLVGVAGLAHPMLTGDGAAQLAVIAARPSWLTVHWSIAFGYVLVAAGLIGVLSLHAPTPGAVAARTGVLLSLTGYVVSIMGVLFMLGAGTTLAHAYRVGEPGLAATHAVFVFDMLHPMARAALRVGAFAVSLGLYSLGWGAVSGGVVPRWLGWLGVGAGVLGAVIALVLPATSPNVVAGVGLATVWQLAAGVTLLTRSATTAGATAA